MDRIYGTLELRATNDELREFEGIANTATEDDHGTIIEPSGVRYKLPIPLLWQHDQKTPVGSITQAEIRGGQLWVKGSIRKVTEPGKVKDATDQAWHNVKYELVRGLSIGFQVLKEKGKRILEWAWRELSLVTIPSNQEANIMTVRSAYLAASGDPQAPASRALNPPPRHGKMTYAERIQSLENSRAAKVARLDELNQKASDEGRTKDETEQGEFNTLHQEVKSVDTELVDVRAMEKLNAAKSTPIVIEKDKSRPGAPIVRVNSRVEPGTGFVRFAMALAGARGNYMEAAERARVTWNDSTPEVELALRAAVAAGTTTDATWAGPLAPVTALASEFLELLRPKTLLGRIPGLRRVPFNISVPAQTSGGTYQWVGEAVAKPITAAAFATVTLRWAKAAGIIVLTDELVRHSTPSAEQVIREEMINGIAQYLDGQFVDPAIAEVTNVSPASITNGVTGQTPGGTTEAFARSDLRTLVKTFSTNNIGLNGVVLLMQDSMAFTLGTLVNAVGAQAFPGLGIDGGSLFGLPVVTSNNVGARIIAVHAPSILYADEGGVNLDISKEASLQMDSAPANPADATTVFVSMFQRNLVALRAERYITWKKARANTVQFIATPAYV